MGKKNFPIENLGPKEIWLKENFVPKKTFGQEKN